MKFSLCSLSFFTFFLCFGSEDSSVIKDSPVMTEFLTQHGKISLKPMRDLDISYPIKEVTTHTDRYYGRNPERDQERRTVYECQPDDSTIPKFYIVVLKLTQFHTQIDNSLNNNKPNNSFSWNWKAVHFLTNDVNTLSIDDIKNISWVYFIKVLPYLLIDICPISALDLLMRDYISRSPKPHSVQSKPVN